MESEKREFEITIVSAHNLPNDRLMGRIKAYAEVLMDGQSFYTTVDVEGDSNPRWNKTFKHTIEESCTANGTFLVVKLLCKRRWRDKQIGDDRIISFKSLFEEGVRDMITYPVFDKEGKDTGGKLTISFRFGNVLVPKPKPSTSKEVLRCCCGLSNCLSALSAFLF